MKVGKKKDIGVDEESAEEEEGRERESNVLCIQKLYCKLNCRAICIVCVALSTLVFVWTARHWIYDSK